MGIWAALDLWYDNTNEAPVVAAAGNHGPLPANTPLDSDFIPGQMGGAAAVGIPGLETSPNTSDPPTVDIETHELFGVRSEFNRT